MPNVYAVKQWFLTYPQCGDLSKEQVLDHLKTIDTVQEYVIALELHQDGHPHLHAFVKFETGVLTRHATPIFDVQGKHGNYQAVRSCINVIKYCTKEDDYISNFDVEAYKKKKGKKKVTTEILKTVSVTEAIDQDYISFHSARNYLFAQSLVIKPLEREDVCGLWIYGKPGTSKSRYARELAGDSLYLKGPNKWFDGYNGEENILLDDLDRSFVNWYGFKIWTDRYACSGQTKGGWVALRHTRFIVTSNYSPMELIKDDEELLEAVTRRCSIIHFTKYTYTLIGMGQPAREQPRIERQTNDEEDPLPFAPHFNRGEIVD